MRLTPAIRDTATIRNRPAKAVDSTAFARHRHRLRHCPGFPVRSPGSYSHDHRREASSLGFLLCWRGFGLLGPIRESTNFIPMIVSNGPCKVKSRGQGAPRGLLKGDRCAFPDSFASLRFIRIPKHPQAIALLTVLCPRTGRRECGRRSLIRNPGSGPTLCAAICATIMNKASQGRLPLWNLSAIAAFARRPSIAKAVFLTVWWIIKLCIAIPVTKRRTAHSRRPSPHRHQRAASPLPAATRATRLRFETVRIISAAPATPIQPNIAAGSATFKPCRK